MQMHEICLEYSLLPRGIAKIFFLCNSNFLILFKKIDLFSVFKAIT